MNCIVRGGYEVGRTGRGFDFHVEKTDLPGRVVDSKGIGGKTGRSRLSELQEKKTKKRRTGH